MVKPLEIYRFNSSHESEIIYTGILDPTPIGGCYHYDSIYDGYMLENSKYDISINSSGDIYLINTYKGKIFLIY